MLPIPGSEIAVGDYSAEYGTVSEVKHNEKTGITHVEFKNGKSIDVGPDEDLFLNQGHGRFDRG